jgi:DNA-binding winged helix-turn-helix (wHTH) protein/tetratricopeptide (TPR) repeat protein
VYYQFDNFDLDTQRAELRRGAHNVAIEPKVYRLLCLLVSNHDRLVSKDEVIEKVWEGRAVSEAVVSTGIKSVRRVLGDDGETQKFVKTIRGRGFRFVAPVSLNTGGNAVAEIGADGAGPDETAARAGKPSLAILPFRLVGYSDKFSAIADALPSELISSLSRLRWLSVMARGSSFRFRGPDPDLAVVQSLLGATYCLTGVVEIFGRALTVSVELSDTGNQAVVWSERFPTRIEDVHETRSLIVEATAAALELHIPLHEAGKARLLAPENLDSWGVYHLGLQHMYRFNRLDNDIAAGHFERATELDPFFARAFAARSFTSFQKAFLKHSTEIEHDRREARLFAEQSLALDPVDPFGNFTLGRAFWLEGDPDGALDWLERSVSLSPNFAHGFYAHAWTDIMAGRGNEALLQVNKAIELSPLDPFLYAMQSVRGMAFVLEGDFENGAIWTDKGARAPGAHFLIGVIAAAAHQLNDDPVKADYWIRNARSRRNDASMEHFFTAFPFKTEALKNLWRAPLASAGF